MTHSRPTPARNSDLDTAIGLVWGQLNTNRFDDAYALAQGCVQIWPADRRLRVLRAYAAVEIGLWLDREELEFLRAVGPGDCTERLLRRAELQRKLLGGLRHD